MSVLTTKYSIGDVVYFGTTLQERKQHPCPDCLGTKKWSATSPAGASYEFACPRCSAFYNGDRDLMLEYTAHAPYVTKLTIGSIQYDTNNDAWHHGGARYMAVETGVGSGSIYAEADLFATEDEARAAALVKAASLDKSVQWVAKLYDKALKISDYQLESAGLKAAAEEKSRARSMLFGLERLFGAIEEAADKDEIIDLIGEYQRFDWAADKDEADKP